MLWPINQFSSWMICDIWLVIFPYCSSLTESPSSRATRLSPCTPCFTSWWVSLCAATYLPQVYCCQTLLPCGKMPKTSYWWERLELQLTNICTRTHADSLSESSEKAENSQRHLASNGKERLEWKKESSPESWWIDECREGGESEKQARDRRGLVQLWVGSGRGGGLACWEIDRLLSAKTLSLSLSSSLLWPGEGAQ